MTKLRKIVGSAVMTGLLCAAGCDGGGDDGETIGPRGGSVVSDDGRFTLTILPGALEQDVEITLARVDCERADALTDCYEVGPVGLALLLPAQVVYEVDEDMLAEVGADDLAVMVEKEEDWNLLADRRVDMSARVVSASAVFLSSFALVAVD